MDYARDQDQYFFRSPLSALRFRVGINNKVNIHFRRWRLFTFPPLRRVTFVKRDKSNQNAGSYHPAPTLRLFSRACSEYALQAPSMGPQRLTGIHARHLPPQSLRSAS